MLATPRLLALLRDHSSGFISGEALSRELGVSRTAIWKHIHQLEAAGYRIEAIPHLGYRLRSAPDRLLPEEIRTHLQTKLFGQQIFAYQQTTSTNDRALELAEHGAAEGTLVTAEFQTQGRGRRERLWLAKANENLLFSLILKPPWVAEQAPVITLLMAAALVKTIRKTTGLFARIKWPNDVLVDQQKVAGILTEMRVQANEIAYLVCGIGVNVNSVPAGNLRQPATCLADGTRKKIPRLPLLAALLQEAEGLYLLAVKEGFSQIRRAWESYFDLSPAPLTVLLGNGEKLEGTILGFDDYGALLLRLDNGINQRITSGELVIGDGVK